MVLIGASIAAIVALEMGSAFQMMNANSNDLKGKMGSVSLTSTLTQVISKPASCMAQMLPAYKTGFSLASASSAIGMPIGFLSNDNVSQIYGPPPVAGATPVPVPNYDVSVNSLTFSNAVAAGVDGSGNNLYLGYLTANLLKMSNNTQQVSGGRGLQTITVGAMYLAVDGTNTIQNCYGQPMTVIAACSSLGGNYVASANPPCELPYPCANGLIFMGYDASQNPICSPAAAQSVVLCPAGHTVVSNGTGYVCN